MCVLSVVYYYFFFCFVFFFFSSRRRHTRLVSDWSSDVCSSDLVERKLPGQFLASMGYVGTQTVHQFGDLNVNASLPGTGQAGQPLNVLFGRATETDLWQGFLSANYHSLQISVNRQFTNGLMVKGAYTYSRAIDFTDDDGWAALVWNDPNVIRRNRAPAGCGE